MTRSTRPQRTPERKSELRARRAQLEVDRRAMRRAARALVGWSHSR